MSRVIAIARPTLLVIAAVGCFGCASTEPLDGELNEAYPRAVDNAETDQDDDTDDRDTVDYADFEGEGEGDEVDPFDAVDCDGAVQDPNRCDYVICSFQSALDDVMATDCSMTPETEQYCEDYLDCYYSYIACFIDACPPGTAVVNADSAEYTACADELVVCTNAIPVPNI